MSMQRFASFNVGILMSISQVSLQLIFVTD